MNAPHTLRGNLHHGQIIGVVNQIKQLMIEEINREINEKVRVYDITVTCIFVIKILAYKLTVLSIIIK